MLTLLKYSIAIAAAGAAHGATLESAPAASALIQGPDVRLIRYADAPGDPEPLYTRVVDGRETGFVRDGGQCMDGKLGGAVIACTSLPPDNFASSALAAVPSTLAAPAAPSAANFHEWPFAPLPIVPSAPAPLPLPPPLPSVPLPGALLLLLGALATLWRFRK